MLCPGSCQRQQSSLCCHLVLQPEVPGSAAGQGLQPPCPCRVLASASTEPGGGSWSFIWACGITGLLCPAGLQAIQVPHFKAGLNLQPWTSTVFGDQCISLIILCYYKVSIVCPKHTTLPSSKTSPLVRLEPVVQHFKVCVCQWGLAIF